MSFLEQERLHLVSGTSTADDQTFRFETETQGRRFEGRIAEQIPRGRQQSQVELVGLVPNPKEYNAEKDVR